MSDRTAILEDVNRKLDLILEGLIPLLVIPPMIDDIRNDLDCILADLKEIEAILLKPKLHA